MLKFPAWCVQNDKEIREESQIIKMSETYVWNEITDHNKYEYSNSNPWMFVVHSHFNLIIVSSCSCVYKEVVSLSLSSMHQLIGTNQFIYYNSSWWWWWQCCWHMFQTISPRFIYVYLLLCLLGFFLSSINVYLCNNCMEASFLCE